MPRFPHAASSAQSLSDRVFGHLVRRSSSVERVYPLHVGDTYLEPIEASRAEYQTTADRSRLHNYSPVQGEPELLEAITRKVARRSGVTLQVSHLQVMAGATAAMGVIVNALIEPGEEVIIPSPFWPLIRGIVRGRGAKAVEVPLFTRLADPTFDVVAAIEAAITERTAAIYLNSPHNPTGMQLSAAAVSGIAQLAERHNLWVFCDEVYEDIWFGSSAPESIWARPDFAARTVATHSVSKAYGLAGARVGYTHGPESAMETIRSVQTFYSYCAARPMQFGAARALSEGDAWLAAMRETYGRAGRAAAEALQIPAPQGGTFLFFDLRPYLRPSETATELLERCVDAGVMLTPGNACGTAYGDWARLCFTSIPEPDLHEALKRLRSVFFSQR